VAKIDETTRKERLERIQRLLLRHPLGLRESEIARRMGLSRRTVNDYLWSADLTGKVYKDGVRFLAVTAKEAVLRMSAMISAMVAGSGSVRAKKPCVWALRFPAGAPGGAVAGL